MKSEYILTYLIFVPSAVIAVMLVLYMVEIIDLFYNQFWDVMIYCDEETNIFRSMLGPAVGLLTVLSLFGMRNASTRPVYYMSIMILLCLIYIFCSWATEWIVVFNVNSTLPFIHDIIKNQTFSNKTQCLRDNFPYSHKLMRLIPCCGYGAVPKPNDTVVLNEWTCFEYLECTGILPPDCKVQIDIWFEENLVSGIGLLADFRIICIVLLINILIYMIVNFEPDSDDDGTDGTS